jgi:uncharacterized Rossmann fold enzyme
MKSASNLSHMTISGWNKRYAEILKEFHYNKEQDLESAWLLNSILKKPISMKKIRKIIFGKPVFVIGAGPSLKKSIPYLKKFQKIPKIVADSAAKVMLDNNIKPDIVVTDLDGDEKSLRRIGTTDTIVVVHAHGDNIAMLNIIENFKNCLGTTQTTPVGNLQNFGGFTDGDRCVFLANHFGVKKIILFGMDFGKKIGIYSLTKTTERKIKQKKLRKAENLLEWLATKSKAKLYTTSKPIKGFKKISFKQLGNILSL